MKLTLTQFVSLDGVSQGPGSPDEDTSGGFTRGGWFVPHMDQDFIAQASSWLDLADALLLGQRTYTAFARDWPLITDPQDPFTARMNSLPKYVASNTLTEGSWNPTTVLCGDISTQLRELKAARGGEIQIHGSSTLAQSLFALTNMPVYPRTRSRPDIGSPGLPGRGSAYRIQVFEMSEAGNRRLKDRPPVNPIRSCSWIGLREQCRRTWIGGQ